MDWVNLPVTQLGAFGVLLGVLWMVFTGRLIPKSLYDSLKEVHIETIARLQEENKEWKEAWRTSEETKETLTEQIGDLLEVGRTTESLIRSIRGDSS